MLKDIYLNLTGLICGCKEPKLELVISVDEEVFLKVCCCQCKSEIKQPISQINCIFKIPG